MVLHTIVTVKKPCPKCKEINPYFAYINNQPESFKHLKWRDKYPEFPTLKASAESGCAICGLLRDALMHKYSDVEIKKAEDDFDESVQSEWPTTKWNGNVEIYGGRFGTESDPAPGRAAGEEHDENFSFPITNFSFNIWPYPPRRQHEESARWDSHRIWFNVYGNSSRYYLHIDVVMLIPAWWKTPIRPALHAEYCPVTMLYRQPILKPS